MTLHRFALVAVSQYILNERLPRERVWTDPRIAAWLVWSMRGEPLTIADNKTFNRARRCLQRNGIRKV